MLYPSGAVGSAVRSVQPGDSVLLSYATCAKCPGCKVNKPFICPKWEAMNFGRLRGSEELGNTPTVKDEEMGSEIHGSLFGQSSMARMALCAESSVSPRAPGALEEMKSC